MFTETPKHILVIEDDRAIRFSLEILLSQEGFQVSTAENGRQALQFLSQAESLPHLILLDLMMPVMDGTEFRKQQQNNPKLSNIPVVLVSANRQAEECRKSLGIELLLRKPVDINELLGVVRRLSSSTLAASEHFYVEALPQIRALQSPL